MTYGATKDMLAGRIAVCGSCGHETPSERASLVSFQGEGSREATEYCTCGFHKGIHQETNPFTDRPGITDHEFAARGPREKDSYYCGCRGWD